MKVWITKYALTQGVYSAEVEVTQAQKMVTAKTAQYTEYFHKPYWHETEEAAKIHAVILRSKKIASLERQIDRLKSIKF